jgi:hypothetical protein
MFIQGDFTVNVTQMLLECVRPNCWTRLGAVWAAHWVIGTWRGFGTFGGNGNRELDKIGTLASLHVDSKSTCSMLYLLQKDLTVRRGLKAQPTRFR